MSISQYSYYILYPCYHLYLLDGGLVCGMSAQKRAVEQSNFVLCFALR